MKIIESINKVCLNGIDYPAKARYVVNDSTALILMASGFNVIADASPWVRRWHGQSLAHKTLLIHAAMGIGDTFLSARLAAVCRGRLGAASVQLAIFSSHHAFWPRAGLPFDLLAETVPFETWQAADFHVTHEGWWESFRAPDQLGTWATIEQACGMRFNDGERVPYIPPVDAAERTKIVGSLLPWLGERPLVLWVLCASSRIRSYHPWQTHQAMQRLVKATGCGIVAIGYPAQVDEYGIESGEDVQVFSGGVPGMLALIAIAAEHPHACLVTPDSAAGHVAACYPALPVVSLWSSFDPSKRVAGYKNHRTLFQKVKCSPCFAHEYFHQGGRTLTGCPNSTCNGYCHGLEAINPALVAGEVEKLLAGVAK